MRPLEAARDRRTQAPRAPRRRSGSAKTEYLLTVVCIGLGALLVVTQFAWRLVARYGILSRGSGGSQGGSPLQWVDPPPLRPPDLPDLVPPPDGSPLRPLQPREEDPGIDPDWFLGEDITEEDLRGRGGEFGKHGEPRVPDKTPAWEKVAGGTDKKWDGSHILTNMTQFDENYTGNWSAVRCTLASHVAARAMNDPGFVDHLVAALQERLEQAQASNDPDAAKALVPNFRSDPSGPRVGRRSAEEYQEGLKFLRKQMLSESLTYGDLGQLQDLLYDAYGDIDESRPGGTSLPQSSNLRLLCNGEPLSWESKQRWDKCTRGGLLSRIKELPPGGTCIVHVPFGTGNHDILVGKDPTGRNYLYDPFPRGVPQLVYLDGPDRDEKLVNEVLGSYEDGGAKPFTILAPVVYRSAPR